jgi:hypothetical protein
MIADIMRKLSPSIGQLVIAAIILMPFAVTPSLCAETVPQVIQVLRVKGHARFSTDNKTWQPLKKGEVLPPGVLIQTGERATVDLQPGDEGAAPTSIDSANGGVRPTGELTADTIRLYENSVLEITKLMADRTDAGRISETQLDLRNGRLLGAVRKSSAASRYEIKFSRGVAGVRDGTYILNASGALDVLYGTTFVAMEAADGVKIVTANHQFDPATGLVSDIQSPLPVEPSDEKPKAYGPVAAKPFQGAGMGGALRKF